MMNHTTETIGKSKGTLKGPPRPGVIGMVVNTVDADNPSTLALGSLDNPKHSTSVNRDILIATGANRSYSSVSI